MQSRIINFHEQHEFVKVKVNSAELNTKNLQDYLTQCENQLCRSNYSLFTNIP